MSDKALCKLCGEPMPQGEEMFKFHGYSGPCPKPPKERWHEVTATCENGHTQKLRLDANSYSKAGAEQWAGLMDGTSPFFLHPPGDESVIGKCGICGKRFKCSVSPAVERGGQS